jgi:hypothetical protein
MSMLAFTAMMSATNSPSTSFGNSDMFMNEGPRYRNRTGFGPPSETT